MAKKNKNIENTEVENKSIEAENKAVEMNKKGVLVRFLQSYTYQAKGDLTRVSEEKAERLAKAGFVEIIK